MVPDVAGKGHSFKGAFAYYLHDKRQDAADPHLTTSERVAWTETRNLVTDGPHTACRIMIATAAQADELKAAAGVKATGRKSNQHAYAYSLAWHPDEAGGLDRAEMCRAVDGSLKALGAEKLQAVIVCHTDQKHPHVHVIVNRVDPENGKMHGLSNDRRKLSAWAAEYERERGQIVTPKRQEKHPEPQPAGRASEGASAPAAARADALAQPKPKPAPADKTPAAMLKELGDAQKARHRQEWAKLGADQGVRRKAIYETAGRHIKAAVAQAKTEQRPLWADFFRQQRDEKRRFEERERRLSGVVRNCIAAAKIQQRHGEPSARGFLTAAFVYLTSRDARRETFAFQQDQQRQQQAATLRAQTDARVSQMKAMRDQTLAKSREIMAGERAALIERQNAERAKVREAWRQLDLQRGRRPTPVQREKPTMRDFDKAAERLPTAKQPTPQPAQRVSTPAPQPTPMGAAPAPRPTQQAPRVDQAKQWAKTPEAAPVMKQQGSPTPPVRKDWNATNTPQPAAPAPRKDWSAATQDKPREIKPLPPRDRSKDYDRER